MRCAQGFSFAFAGVVMAAAVLSAGRAAAGELPEKLVVFNLATLPEAQFDGGAWSPPSDENGTPCRKALTGKTSGVRIKAWWKEGDLRPAEGEAFILEVQYKDVLPKPAQFLIRSGVGYRFGFSLLHQFGGAHDGQWKTACVPAPWTCWREWSAPLTRPRMLRR
jgi:hypothetical protein